jgi:hypothetical protein
LTFQRVPEIMAELRQLHGGSLPLAKRLAFRERDAELEVQSPDDPRRFVLYRYEGGRLGPPKESHRYPDGPPGGEQMQRETFRPRDAQWEKGKMHLMIGDALRHVLRPGEKIAACTLAIGPNGAVWTLETHAGTRGTYDLNGRRLEPK